MSHRQTNLLIFKIQYDFNLVTKVMRNSIVIVTQGCYGFLW